MNFLFIIGECAVGKMTVGQEIAELTGYKLFYNHLTIEPVIEVLGEFNMDVTNRLRDVFFSEFAKLELPGVIFTVGIDYCDDSAAFYIAEVMEKIPGAKFYCLELVAPFDTRVERSLSENRLKYKPSQRDVESVYDRMCCKEDIGRHVPEGFVLDALKFKDSLLLHTQEMSAKAAAERAVSYFGFEKEEP